jgi:hypothetical protein
MVKVKVKVAVRVNVMEVVMLFEGDGRMRENVYMNGTKAEKKQKMAGFIPKLQKK